MTEISASMTPLQWFQAVWMVVITALLPFLWFLWRTARRAGQQERRRDDLLRTNGREVSDLTATVQRELKRVESQAEVKVDVKTFLAVQERVASRMDYLEKRLDDFTAHTNKRIDKEGERLSALTGKLTKWHEDVRDASSEIRERLARLEPRS